MKAYTRSLCACFCSLLFIAPMAMAKPTAQIHAFTEPEVYVDVVGDVDGTNPAPQKVLQDTIWIAEWTHDSGAPCDFTGWEKVDNHILNDGSVFWDLDNTFGGIGNIVGTAAALGYENDVCCEDANGYDNNWYQGIRIEYTDTAPADLSFDYELDTEGGFDFLQVEEDSACASFDRVDFDADPSSSSASFRNLLHSDSGLLSGANVSNLALTQFGAGTSCVYIGFLADIAFSPCDGLQPTTIGKAIVVDNIVLDENGVLTTEDFEDLSLDIGTFVNMLDSAPFGPISEGGSWARTFDHITDNDVCTENTSCALLWTDFTTPTIANDPSMAFAPNSFVIRNWLDDIVISPWVDLSSTPDAKKTIIQFRRFPGNFFSTSRVVQGWAVRGKEDVDDGMGGMVECISAWGHALQWNSLDVFFWGTPTASGNPPASGYDMTPDFPATAKLVQVRHRVSDWQWIAGASTPPIHTPGPGPYTDKTRIGRLVLGGPVINEGIDARQQAQDTFASEIDPTISPGTGEHHRPTTDRFGVGAFVRGQELTVNAFGPNIVTGDSIHVSVQDIRGNAITAISVFASIVGGPHQGKAPPPHVSAGGIFQVPASQALASTSLPQANCGVGCVPNPGVIFIQDNFFIDLDDEYFVGGDVLQYVWLAEDDGAGFTSDPVGLTGVPGTWAEAQAATNGLFEVNFLPTINWDPDFLAAVDANNKVDPNSDPAFLDESTQRNCILYVNHVNARRRSGDFNRTSFMYALDRLGYRGHFDVYDHTGMGNTNNHLGSRATVQQAQGYNLIVYDAGINGPSGTIMPAGDDLDSQKVDQAGWFRDWLAQASVSEAGFATLWVIAANALEERETNPLYATDMGTDMTSTDQGLNANPDVIGQTSFAFDVGAGSNNVDFTTGPKAEFSLNGGCTLIRDYDGQSATSGTDVYLFADPNSGTTGDASIVMNSNAAANWNTIMMSFAFFDVREDFGQAPSSLTSGEDFVKSVLEGTLPLQCIQGINPTDVGGEDEIDAPHRTVLYLNRPNPFNPMTTIRFDLAQSGQVSLKIYDVAGRLVRTLIDEKMTAGRNIQRVWDGLDDGGQRTSSGVYFYRLEAPNFSAVNKMVMMK